MIIWAVALVFFSACQTLPEGIVSQKNSNLTSTVQSVCCQKVVLNSNESLTIRIPKQAIKTSMLELELVAKSPSGFLDFQLLDQYGHRFNVFQGIGQPLKKGLNRLRYPIADNTAEIILRIHHGAAKKYVLDLNAIQFSSNYAEPFYASINTVQGEQILSYSDNQLAEFPNNAKEISLLIKLWGLSKYSEQPLLKNEPGLDIDTQLFTLIGEWLDYKGTFSDFLSAQLLIQSIPNEFTHQTNESLLIPLEWLQDEMLADHKVAIKAHLEQTRLGGAYVTYAPLALPTNEYSYQFTDDSWFSLLMLARTWSALNYLSPNVALAKPEFLSYLENLLVSDELRQESFNLRRQIELIAIAFQDGHVRTNEPFDRSKICSLPINLNYIEDQLFVSGIRKQDAVPPWLAIGTEVTAIDGQPITEELIKTAGNSYSNEKVSALINARRLVFEVECDGRINIVFKAQEKFQDWTFNSLSDDAFPFYGNTRVSRIKPELPEEISLIYGARDSSRTELDNAFAKSKIIIDLRQYPSMTHYSQLPLRILAGHRRGYELRLQNRKNHGELVSAFYNDAFFESEHRPFQGDVIVLVNENTGSRAEALAMTLQQSENVRVIGSHTQGLGGSASHIALWQHASLQFTAEAMFDLNGEWVHQRGVLLDEYIKPTKAEYLAGKDVQLERAIELLLAD